MQLIKSPALVQDRQYIGQRLGYKFPDLFIARCPEGKSFIALFPVRGGSYVPADYFDWWTDDMQKTEAYVMAHEVEYKKVEAELARRAEKRRKKK